MAKRIAHRASILQAFHSGVSETQRQAMIDAQTTTEQPTTITPAIDNTTRKLPAGQKVGRGYVRTISDKQKNLILKLINEKDLTNLTLYPGQTIDPAEIGNMGVKGGTALIDKLFALPNKPTVNSVRMATEGQKRFIASLNAQANSPLSEGDISTITFDEVNEVLAHLKSIIAHNTKHNTSRGEGGYIDDTTGKVYNVYKARQGSHLLVKVLDVETKSWEYVGAIAKLPTNARKLTLDEAKHYGKLTVQCCICGRKLTNKESKEKGIGPICEGRI